MARILITSGPTREYLDPVRYLTNGSSGRMGAALAAEGLRGRHEIVVVSGPVQVTYPQGAEVIDVETTEEMLTACLSAFAGCDGVIAAAAPCDFRPRSVASQKISKSDDTFSLDLIQTPDILATLGQRKRSDQWSVGFALETHDGLSRAAEKLRRKSCDLMVLNDASSIDATSGSAVILDRMGPIARVCGTKQEIAARIWAEIDQRFLAAKRP